MCGIVGFIGSSSACDILLSGLSKLEYRGYDSAGIAVLDRENGLQILKAKGKLGALRDKISEYGTVHGNIGIGHTRWATHGEPSENNAHPHHSDDMAVTGVHNGIIENYQEIREKLSKNGYNFYSETDTEVLIKFVDYYLKKYALGPRDAIIRAMVSVRGSYSAALMFSDYPDEIWVMRKDSPMIIGINEGNTYIASDVPAILEYTRDVYYIDNLELACLKAGEAHFYDMNGDTVEKETVNITWDASSAEKGGYEHFMMKEIMEQPKVVGDTIRSALMEHDKGRAINPSAFGLTEEEILGIKRVVLAGCGSAWHVGMALSYVIEGIAKIPVRVEYASEFRYRNPLIGEGDLVIVISQSGETADSLAALREAKKKGVKTLGIVNVVGSSIARESDNVFYTLAGPEIAVATTKAYSCQLAAGYLLSVLLGHVKGNISEEEYMRYINELESLPAKIEALLAHRERLQWFASKFSGIRDAFFIGRGLDYAISLEGSLKMKEVSYVHSEAYPAGELKHGTISLVEDGTLLIGLLTQSAQYEKTLANMAECKTRGAYLMALTPEGHFDIEDTADFSVYLPKCEEYFMGSLEVVPLQLIGYYLSCARGIDVDKPRNLAKSVTVE